MKNRVGERKSEGCKNCRLPHLCGLEEVLVTRGPHCIQVQWTVPLTDSTGWLKECVAKHQCWIFPMSAKTGGFELGSQFWFQLSLILQEKWLKLAVSVIVKEVLFVCLHKSLLTVTEFKSFQEVQQILDWCCILYGCQHPVVAKGARISPYLNYSRKASKNFLGMKWNDGFFVLCALSDTMPAWCTSHFVQ